jgi:hypothetical protein
MLLSLILVDASYDFNMGNLIQVHSMDSRKSKKVHLFLLRFLIGYWISEICGYEMFIGLPRPRAYS